MKTNITSSIVSVTPEMAESWLTENISHNRPVVRGNVKSLARSMSIGEWKLNGQAIIFSDNDKMIDGQHRMLAVIESGKAIDFVVIRGVEESSYATIDQGSRRTSGAILASDGVSNYNNTASAVIALMTYREAIAKNEGSGGSYQLSDKRVSGPAVLELYRKNSCAFDFCSHLAVRLKSVIIQSVSAGVSAIAIIDAKHSNEEVEYFWEKVRTGEGLFKGDPAHTLRETFLGFNKYKKPSQAWQVAAAIKCWNAYVLNKQVKILRVIEGEPIQRVI